MTEDVYTSKLDELDRLISDPHLQMEPDLIWSLLDEIIAGPRRETPDSYQQPGR